MEKKIIQISKNMIKYSGLHQLRHKKGRKKRKMHVCTCQCVKCCYVCFCTTWLCILDIKTYYQRDKPKICVQRVGVIVQNAICDPLYLSGVQGH